MARIHESGLSWFVASTKFGVDNGIVVVAAEDDATVSMIPDVGMVQQIERLTALMDSISLSADFDGQVPCEETTDLRNRALRGDWSSAELATKTSAKFCTPWSCCPAESPWSKGSVSRWRRNATWVMPRFLFSVAGSVEVSQGTKLAQADGCTQRSTNQVLVGCFSGPKSTLHIPTWLLTC